MPVAGEDDGGAKRTNRERAARRQSVRAVTASAALPNDPANNLQALVEQGFWWPDPRKAAAAISRLLQGALKRSAALKAPARFIGLLGSTHSRNQRVKVEAKREARAVRKDLPTSAVAWDHQRRGRTGALLGLVRIQPWRRV